MAFPPKQQVTKVMFRLYYEKAREHSFWIFADMSNQLSTAFLKSRETLVRCTISF